MHGRTCSCVRIGKNSATSSLTRPDLQEEDSDRIGDLVARVDNRCFHGSRAGFQFFDGVRDGLRVSLRFRSCFSGVDRCAACAASWRSCPTGFRRMQCVKQLLQGVRMSR